MKSDSKKRGASFIIIWSLVWAFALIATAFFFKANPAKYWIEAGLNVIGILVFLLLLKSRRMACVR